MERCIVTDNAKIIATAGKGGVGKTSISALLVKQLVKAKPDAKILAIDADPAVGLATALGVDVNCTIDDIRKSFIGSVEKGDTRAAIEMLNEAQYRIFDAMIETNGFAFIAVGRPESAGCYCKVNSYLKDVISVLSQSFDYVVIDGEAGIEQINRRVMEKVTHLLVVSDSSRKGIQVIQTIKRVADELVMYEKIGAVINRVRSDAVRQLIDTDGIEIVSFIDEDEVLNSFDIEGKDLFFLPDDAKAAGGVYQAMINMDIL